MKANYKDILDRIAEEPIWFDEAGVPRYCDFSPNEISNIYAKEVALVEIACQNCGTRFNVAIAYDPMADLITPWKDMQFTMVDSIKGGGIGYGDPPNIWCCPPGPTMSSDTIRVIEFWYKNKDLSWERDPKLEIVFQ